MVAIQNRQGSYLEFLQISRKQRRNEYSFTTRMLAHWIPDIVQEISNILIDFDCQTH